MFVHLQSAEMHEQTVRGLRLKWKDETRVDNKITAEIFILGQQRCLRVRSEEHPQDLVVVLQEDITLTRQEHSLDIILTFTVGNPVLLTFKSVQEANLFETILSTPVRVYPHLPQ